MRNKIVFFIVVCALLNYTGIIFGMQPVPSAVMNLVKQSKDNYHKHIKYVLDQPSNEPDPNNCLYVFGFSAWPGLPLVDGLIIQKYEGMPAHHSLLVYVDPADSKFKRVYIEHWPENFCPASDPGQNLVVYNQSKIPLFRLNIIEGKLPYKVIKTSAFDKLLKALRACYSEYPFIIISGAVISGITIAAMQFFICKFAIRLSQ